jgi:preprotein translocase subunit SecG
MGTVISILIILVCVFLILVVLVQNSKGGGLASSFASSNQVMGVRKTGDFLEKATWTLAAALLVFCLWSTAYDKPAGGSTKSTESVTRQKGAEEGTPANTSTAPAAKTQAAPVNPTPATAPNKTVPPTGK